LVNHYSVPDDLGNPIVPAEFHNPLPRIELTQEGRYDESTKAVLPYRYIREIRNIVCPDKALSFRDWTWAQQQSRDWLIVAPAVIDKKDPDCVWRMRKATKSERGTGYPDQVYELWSPVRAVCLYVKLELPLRTFQVRMLDSGESDTWRYESGEWKTNKGSLHKGTVKRPFQHGVFRRIESREVENGVMTGLYINTNKTADISKEDWAKGYVVPWQHTGVLYWLDRLRNWQQKYNPLVAPTQWASLQSKHFDGHVRHPDVLASLGEACFLFRDAAAPDRNDRDKPIAGGTLVAFWDKALGELEDRCYQRGETLAGGQKIEFTNPRTELGNYTLHTLRVSLITAYALEGGVPMPILCKCIAGHSRLVMTLYYTKPGIARVTATMEEAEKRIIANNKSSLDAFLREGEYQQIVESVAHNASVGIAAAATLKNKAGMEVMNHGICPQGLSGCMDGGENVGTPTNPVYAPVPGYPRKNCVRCRWFITGPGFLHGLVAHFNDLSYQVSDLVERLVGFEGHVTALEDEQIDAERSGRPFAKVEELRQASRLRDDETAKVDQLANDMNATFSLIQRCMGLLENAAGDERSVRLVPAGTMHDLAVVVQERSKQHQLQIICENAIVYPEIDARKAVLERSQALDAMLELHGKPPVFFKLSLEQQHLIGNELVRFWEIQMGNIDGAISILEGKIRLEEIGLLGGSIELLERQAGIPMIQGVTINQHALNDLHKQQVSEGDTHGTNNA
jgi:hypothetical protein